MFVFQTPGLTFATASSKSSCVTCTLRSRSAYIPDSVHTPCRRNQHEQPVSKQHHPSTSVFLTQAHSSQTTTWGVGDTENISKKINPKHWQLRWNSCLQCISVFLQMGVYFNTHTHICVHTHNIQNHEKRASLLK